MKGTFFQRPLELKIEIDGESWNQGDEIKGRLEVRNHGGGDVSDIHVHLAHGGLKKVHDKAEGALKVISTTSLPTGATELEWSFQTDRNCPITDNLSSLFVVYGKGPLSASLGVLELQINPYWVIQEFQKTIQIQHRFIFKAQKASKGRVEAKLLPPDGPSFAKLDHLLLHSRFEGDNLEVSYTFNVKQLEASAAAIDVKKKKKELVQTFGPSDYLTSSGRYNHERIEAAVKEALGQIG